MVGYLVAAAAGDAGEAAALAGQSVAPCNADRVSYFLKNNYMVMGNLSRVVTNQDIASIELGRHRAVVSQHHPTISNMQNVGKFPRNITTFITVT
jgi:hypothetical protein